MAFSRQIVIDPNVKSDRLQDSWVESESALTPPPDVLKRINFPQDCILFAITPPDASRSAFHELREVVPVRLSTDPWAPSSAGIGASI
jgi:hypothetical protein